MGASAHAAQAMAISLISVLVSENLLDEAWAAAMANPGEFPEFQWFQLIEVREKDRPADVIRPYGTASWMCRGERPARMSVARAAMAS